MKGNLLKPNIRLNRNDALIGQSSDSPDSNQEVRKSKLTVKVMNKIISGSLFMIFFGIPLFFTGLNFQGIIFEKQIYFYFWALLALVAWVSKGVLAGEMKIRRTPLDIPLAVFWVAYLLSTIFSVDRWHSFWGFFGDPSRGLMSITALILVYYIIASNFTLRRFKWLVGALVSSSIIVSVWTALGILGIQFLPAKIMSLAPLSLIGSVSGLGTFFGLMIPILMVVIFKINENQKTENKKLIRVIFSILLFLAMAIDLFLLLSIYGFVSWVGVLVGVSFFLIYILSRVVRPKESWTWLPLAVFVLIMTILMVGKVDIARVNLPVEVSPSYNLSWEIAKDSLKENFLLGSGPATYGYDFSAFSSQDFNLNAFYQLRFYQGTGLFFESISTLGIAGTIALIILVLSFISVAVYLMSRDKKRNKIYSLGLVSAMIVLIVNSFAIRTEGTMIFLAALIGSLTICVLFKESGLKGSYLNLSLKSSPKFALALAFIFIVVSAGVAFLFAFIGKVYMADIYAGSAIREEQISREGSIQKLIKAINLYNKEGRYYLRAGQECMILANQEILKGEEEQNLNDVQAYLNDSIQLSKKGIDLMRNDVLAIETLAQIYENTGLYVADSLKLSEEQYRKALDLEPRNPSFYLKLGQIKTNQVMGKSDDEKKQLIVEAKNLFQKSIDKKSNFAPGHYQLALMQEALGEIDGAIENMNTAVRLNPNDINYIFALGRMYQGRGDDADNKIAEKLFLRILEVNDKEINALFNLGLLYENMERKDEAIKQYEKVVSLLSDKNEDVRKQIEKMIENVKNGIKNTAETINTQAVEQTQNAPVEIPEESSPLVEPELSQPSIQETQIPQESQIPENQSQE